MATVVVIVLFVALLTSVPIAVALGLASLAGLLMIAPNGLVLLPQKILSGMDAFTLLAIPLFILAGTIMGRGGIARRIVNLALIFVGRIKGGLGFVVILSTMFFSGVCGSASADTAAIGSTTMPEMLRRKYPKPFATALLAASGATASIIPPSIDLIIIGVVAGISIGGLFAAGLLPGVFNAIALMALCYYYGRRLDLPVADSTSWSEKLRIFADGSLAVLMPVIILGGIFRWCFHAHRSVCDCRDLRPHRIVIRLQGADAERLARGVSAGSAPDGNGYANFGNGIGVFVCTGI